MAIKRAEMSGMRLLTQTDREVVMEMNLGTENSSFQQYVKKSVQKKAVMKFSNDLSLLFEQKIYEDNQLVELISYDYQNDNENLSKKGSLAVRKFFPSSSVSRITFKALMVKDNGRPYIKVRKENFKKNQVQYNF